MSSKCTICFTEHDRLWHDNTPALYCQKCSDVKRALRGQASQILDTLFLSDWVAAQTYKAVRLCVHEDTPDYEGPFIHVPVLDKLPNSNHDRNGACISLAQIDVASNIIDGFVKRGEPLLVHCRGGVERSPLTVAWYLVKSGRCESLQEAYIFLKQKRQIVSDRMIWLPKWIPLKRK